MTHKLVYIGLDVQDGEEQLCYVRAMESHEFNSLLDRVDNGMLFTLDGIDVYYDGSLRSYRKKKTTNTVYITPRHITDISVSEITLAGEPNEPRN
jgi:hypothetical protein